MASAAAIWSLADIAYIAIYCDMNKISRYSIAIFLSIFIEQLFINNRTIFMQVEACVVMVATQEQTHKMLYGTGGGVRPGGVGKGGGGGEKRHYTYIPRYT